MVQVPGPGLPDEDECRAASVSGCVGLNHSEKIVEPGPVECTFECIRERGGVSWNIAIGLVDGMGGGICRPTAGPAEWTVDADCFWTINWSCVSDMTPCVASDCSACADGNCAACAI